MSWEHTLAIIEHAKETEGVYKDPDCGCSAVSAGPQKVIVHHSSDCEHNERE